MSKKERINAYSTVYFNLDEVTQEFLKKDKREIDCSMDIVKFIKKTLQDITLDIQDKIDFEIKIDFDQEIDFSTTYLGLEGWVDPNDLPALMKLYNLEFWEEEPMEEEFTEVLQKIQEELYEKIGIV
jgi:hypothetical protein